MKPVDKVLVAMILLIVLLVGIAGSQYLYRDKAIEHGCAEYNITTGEFGWKERKDE